MTTAQLTPQSNQTPAVVSVTKELSGLQWVARFQGSSDTSALTPQFRTAVDLFIAAMRAAGAAVHVSSTYRPPERSYLMHWAWRIKNGADPALAPARDGVNIEWVHPTLADSREAARQMAVAYSIDNLGVAPAIHSLHNDRQAIDMRISWNGTLAIRDPNGTIVEIDTAPRTGMNAQLKAVGAAYDVKKFVGGASDKPHWSTTGH